MWLIGSWLFYAILSVIPLIYWYLSRKFNYWSDRGIKGPKPIPIFGNILDIFITPQPIVDCKWLKTYGKVFGYYFGKAPVLTIAEPELIKLVLVKDFHLFIERRHQKSLHPILSKSLSDATGDDWKRIRSIASPTFSSGKMKRMYPLIRECLKDFSTHLELYAKDRQDINVKEMFGNFTMDVIATCAFATKTNVRQKDNPFVVNARKLFDFNVFRLIPLLILPQFVINFLEYNTRGDEESNNFFLNTIRYIIQNRRQSNKKFYDFIQLLLEAEKERDLNRDDNDMNESHHVNEGEDTLEAERKALNINYLDKRLSEDEVLAQAFAFFIGAYETTAATLTFASYEMALNPDIQQKLYEEVMTGFDSNGEIDYEILSRLPYLDSVISETLRLHSPALRVARIASTDYKLGDSGITIEKGVQIEIPIYAIHVSEDFYENPMKFDPDRFLAKNRDKLKPYTYLPFGAGPRNCIAMRFALLEVKSGLAHIIRKYRFFRSPKTEVPFKLRRYFRLNSTKNLVVGIEMRENN